MALKQFKPNTPSQRGLVLVDRSSWKGKPVKALTEGLKSHGGRTTTGRLTMRRRGGGHKRRYRIVDFKRTKFDVPGTIERLEYDPNRSAFIALVNYQDGEQAYILAPQRLAVGDQVVSARPALTSSPGNAMPMENIPVGTIIHNVEMKQGAGGQSPAFPGTYASWSARTRATPSCACPPVKFAWCPCAAWRRSVGVEPGQQEHQSWQGGTQSLEGPSPVRARRRDEPGGPSPWRRRRPHLGRPPSCQPVGQADEGQAYTWQEAERQADYASP